VDGIFTGKTVVNGGFQMGSPKVMAKMSLDILKGVLEHCPMYKFKNGGWMAGCCLVGWLASWVSWWTVGIVVMKTLLKSFKNVSVLMLALLAIHPPSCLLHLCLHNLLLLCRH
jgi:hypothetical protein